MERHARGTVSSSGHGFNWRELLGAFKDPWTWMIGLIHFFGGAAFNSYAASRPVLPRVLTRSLGVFLTAIIRDMGYTSIAAQGLGAPAWMAAYVVAITCGYFSDRWSVRGWFIAAGQLVGAVGYLVIAFAGPIGVRYFAVYITVCGVYMAQPLM